MKQQLLDVLPYIFEHLTPPFPDTFNHFGAAFTLRVAYDTTALLNCALVCKQWTWHAQVQLFRRPILARPLPGEDDMPDTNLGGRVFAERFRWALDERPQLGTVVRALSISISASSQVLVDILTACTRCNMLLVLFPYVGFERYSLPQWPLSPSIHVLGITSLRYSKDPFAFMHEAYRIFPSLQVLQLSMFGVSRVQLERPPSAQGRFPLRELSMHASSSGFIAQIAPHCVPGIAVLRMETISSVERTVLPLAATLRELYVANISSSESLPFARHVDMLAQCSRLRRLYIEHVPTLPSILPPALEHFEAQYWGFHNLPFQSLYDLLARHPSVHKCTLYLEPGMSASDIRREHLASVLDSNIQFEFPEEVCASLSDICVFL